MYKYADGTYASGWFEVDGIQYYASVINAEVFKTDKSIGGKYYLWNEETGYVLANGFVELDAGTVCYVDGVEVTDNKRAVAEAEKIFGSASEDIRIAMAQIEEFNRLF